MTANALIVAKLASAYYSACMLELQALKPGNVHMFADGHGMTVQDFIKSADASVLVIARANLTVGERILKSVEATHNAVGKNTNLGLILLCAPLIHAALSMGEHQSLQHSVASTLNQLSADDGLLAGQAIVLANPAGLGRVAEYDVHDQTKINLLTMMQSAQDKDFIAWQYTHAFSDIFEFAVPRYRVAENKWQDRAKTQSDAWAATAVYLGFLARQLDSHVVRKHGEFLAKELMYEARVIEADYWATDNPKLMQKRLLTWDASLKERNINPGTSADLTVACLLVNYLQ